VRNPNNTQRTTITVQENESTNKAGNGRFKFKLYTLIIEQINF